MRSRWILASLLLSSCAATNRSTHDQVLTDAEIQSRLETLRPKDEDFRFEHPRGWSPVAAHVTAVSPGESLDAASAVVDGNPATTWTTARLQPCPFVVLALPTARPVDKLVTFARHTVERGTAVGCNAVKRIRLSYATTGTEFTTIGEFPVTGPAAICFKRQGGGQACGFIDRSIPTVIEFAPVVATALRVDFVDAYWEPVKPDMPPEVAASFAKWQNSIAVSELLLFTSE